MHNQPSPLTPADAERLAREGVRPVGKWDQWNQKAASLANDEGATLAEVFGFPDGLWAVTVLAREVVGPEFASQEAAQLYAESRLRDATLPLHAPEIARLEARVAALRKVLDGIAQAPPNDCEWTIDAAEDALRKDASHAS